MHHRRLRQLPVSVYGVTIANIRARFLIPWYKNHFETSGRSLAAAERRTTRSFEPARSGRFFLKMRFKGTVTLPHHSTTVIHDFTIFTRTPAALSHMLAA